MARLRRVVAEGGRGRRVRAQDERRHDRHAAQGQGQLQGPRVRRGRHAARVPQRPGGVRQGRVAVSRSTTGRPATLRRPSSCRPRRAACRRGWSSAIRRRRVSRRTASGSISARRRRPRRRRRKARRSRARVDIWHWQDPLLQPMQRVRAAAGAQPQLSRRRAPRRQAVRPAGDAGVSERGPGRGCRARRRHVRPAVPAARCRGTRATTTSRSSI